MVVFSWFKRFPFFFASLISRKKSYLGKREKIFPEIIQKQIARFSGLGIPAKVLTYLEEIKAPIQAGEVK